MRDYVELVKGLRCCSEIDARNNGCESCPYEYCGDDCQNLCGCAADAIEELLAAVPQWISVKERLPEIGKRVLAVESHLIQNVRFRNEYESWFDTDGIFVNEQISHWMPLPKPMEVSDDA